MHYIRLLRAPKLTVQEGKKPSYSVNVILTITTDLGDSFLADDETVSLKVSIGWEKPHADGTRTELKTLAASKVLRWTSSMRVLKADIPVPRLADLHPPGHDAGPLRVLFQPPARKAANHAADVALAGFAGECGRIMPVCVDVHVPGSEAPTTCLRRLGHAAGSAEPGLEIEEDIGESIARHLWDAGVAAVSRLWLLNGGGPSLEAAEHPTPMTTLHALLFGGAPVNILELGCGVGILGVGLARMMAASCDPDRPGTILMTDLPEAEERARANIARLAAPAPVRPEYENLDWDDGRDGAFGPLARSRAWDLVVLSDCTYNVDALPALVDTWTAVHRQNLARGPGGRARTRVAVAMKKRHSDEERLWRLIDEDGWSLVEEDAIALPVLGGEDQRIFLYLFETERTDFAADSKKA